MKSFTTNTSKNFSIYARIANLKKNPIFSVLSEFKLFLLCKEFKPLEFQNNQEIIFEEINSLNTLGEKKIRKIKSSNLDYENNNINNNNINKNLNKCSSFNPINNINSTTNITRNYNNNNLTIFRKNNTNSDLENKKKLACTDKKNSMIIKNNKLNIPNFNNANNINNNNNINQNYNFNENQNSEINKSINNIKNSISNNYIKITNIFSYNTNNFSSTYNLERKTNSFLNNALNTSSNNLTNKGPTGGGGAGATSPLKEKLKFSTNKTEAAEGFFNNETIFISKIFIIFEGKIKFYKNAILIKELQTNAIFADISFGLNLTDKSGETAVAEGAVKCYCISAKTFRENVDENYFNYIQSILVLQDTSVNLENLFFVKNVGNGKYGKVFLVHNRKNLYALKAADLQSIRKEPYLVKYYMNEKALMQQIDHPFIVKLVKTMKNFEMIFFLMEFIDGVTLKFYFEKRGKNENKIIEEAQFLGAILLIIVNYLHKKRIIHRDIKPENIMVDQSVGFFS